MDLPWLFWEKVIKVVKSYYWNHIETQLKPSEQEVNNKLPSLQLQNAYLIVQ